ncbi:MAG: sirohydrochlorin cobaltochelatase [Nitrospirota bacterium]
MKERKLKKRNLKDTPALVIAAFGTTSKGKVAYDIFDAGVRAHFADNHAQIVWAYTSEIVREKTGSPGILQALASLEEHGYRKAVVQPLHIVPGTEYQELADMCTDFPGMRVVMGETLLHRWQFVDDVIAAVAQDFIPEGINVIAAHGTPLCADPANILYQGLDYYLTHKFPNCFFATVDGMPSMELVLKKIAAEKPLVKRARLIPLLYVSGLHVEKDLVGETQSLKANLEALDLQVDYLSILHEGGSFVKSLGFYEEVRSAFINRIERALKLLYYY